MATVLRNYVSGKWVETGRTYPNINPVNGSKVCDVFEADEVTVAQAVDAAHAAMHGEWGRLSANDRSALLHQVADQIEARFDDFLEAEITDTGHSYPQARNVDIPRGAANFRIFADLIRSYPNDVYEMATPDGGKALNYSHRRPLGVVAVIAPWVRSTWLCRSMPALGGVAIVPDGWSTRHSLSTTRRSPEAGL